MKRKLVAALLVCAMTVSMAACGNKNNGAGNGGGNEPKQEEGSAPKEDAGKQESSGDGEEKQESTGAVKLEVVTTYAGNDTNAQNYKDSYKAWEKESGNTVVDMSASTDATFKTRVATDFETNSEPDVLFFFNGADSASFIEAGKVVSIEDIRAEYPDYANNMDDSKIPVSSVDGKAYAVPVNGIWEGLFFNKEILEKAGVETPGADYTWDQFLADCQKIKDAGYTPIAAALGHIPHYWWEYSIFNHTGPENHLTIPESIDSDLGKDWVAGITDIKTLYDKGFFPENTLSATDDESFAMFTEEKAAFLLDGSWKVGGIASACQSDPEDPSTLDDEKLGKYGVTFVPGTDARKATDLIGGLTSGYFITKKAWDDPDKRAAAVSFVTYMTSNETVSLFTQHGVSALKEIKAVDKSQFNSLQLEALNMMEQATSTTLAVQDAFDGQCRVSTFDGMPEIVSGSISPEDAVAEGLDVYNAQ